MLLATASSPWRTSYFRAIAPSVSPDFTMCLMPSEVGRLAAALNGSADFAATPVDGVNGTEATLEFDLPGMSNFWPGLRLAFAERLLAAVSCATVTLFLRAIVQRLSPDFTVYDDAGVMSPIGSDISAPATGVFGRVGTKRSPADAAGAGAAGAFGLKVIAEEDDSAAGVVAVGALLGAEPTDAGGVFEAVSAAAGGVLLVELQPGLAKIRISAKR